MKGEINVSIEYNVMIQREENWYVAKCIDNSVAPQGKTIEEAMENLKEALELYTKSGKYEIFYLNTKKSSSGNILELFLNILFLSFYLLQVYNILYSRINIFFIEYVSIHINNYIFILF